MSQAGLISVAGGGGTTSYVENAGTATPVAGVLNVVGGIGITTSGAGNTVTITATSMAFTWNNVTGATQTLAAENGYITNNAGGVTYTLPASGNLGDTIVILGKSGSWSISQNAGQQIFVGSSSSTVGVGGSVSSTKASDSLELICITSGASTGWRAMPVSGNLTIV